MALPIITWNKPSSYLQTPALLNVMLDGDSLTREVLAASTHEVASTLADTPTAIRKILEEQGTPGVEGAKSAKEEVIGLLQLAAEVEHSLMVQYLYSAASLAQGSNGGNDAWTKIMTVATQEMGHLISVQNLLLLVGGPSAFHFGRDGIRASSPQNPLPLVLEPISRAALAKFIVAEMPAQIEEQALHERIEIIRKMAEESAGITPHRVGTLYAKLFWLFQPDDNPLPPFNLSPAPHLGLKAGWHLTPQEFSDATTIAQFQATRDEWVRGGIGGFILETVANAAAARALIIDISEQGEGLGEKHDSHFYEFLEMLDLLEAEKLTVTPLPTSPVASNAAAPDAGPRSEITTPYAKWWADLFDVRYSLLVLDLWHAMATPGPSAIRTSLIQLAYANMKFVGEITKQLLRLREQGATDAAPPFALLHDDLPDTNQRWERHQELLRTQATVVDKIKRCPEFQDCSTGECEVLDFEGNNCLQNIEQNDAVRNLLISK